MRWWLAAALALLLGVGLTYGAMRFDPFETDLEADPYDTPAVKTIRVSPRADARKAGAVHGVMGWRYFEFPAGDHGESNDELRFAFARPAEILQVDVSVDVSDSRLRLVELAVGINATGYGFSDGEFDRGTDWLAHVSWAGRAPDEMEETTRLPEGVHVRSGDYVGVGAYLGGTGSGDPLRVSPEVVILYRWI
jgi:hypothetical protein